MGHENRNWRRRWVVNASGRSAMHETGLVVMFDGDRLVTGEANRARVFELLAADSARGTHAGARLSTLIRQGERMLRGE